ncbi:MAG TPA: response regulator [Burkholderiaceae bacterium]
MSSKPAALPRVLLFEPHFVLRRTIVSVARDLGVAEIQEVNSIDRARAELAARPYEGVVLDFDDSSRAADLLGELRLGRFYSRPDVPVVVMAAEMRPRDEQRLEALAVTQVLHKPFKIGDLLNAMGSKGRGGLSDPAG